MYKSIKKKLWVKFGFFMSLVAGSNVPDSAQAVSVLLVEDTDLIRNLAVKQLTFRGYIVVAAKTGEDAIHLYEQSLADQPFDIVMTDFNLRGVHPVSYLHEQEQPVHQVAAIDGDDVVKGIEKLAQERGLTPFFVTISGGGNYLERGNESFLFTDIFQGLRLGRDRYLVSQKPIQVREIMKDLPIDLKPSDGPGSQVSTPRSSATLSPGLWSDLENAFASVDVKVASEEEK